MNLVEKSRHSCFGYTWEQLGGIVLMRFRKGVIMFSDASYDDFGHPLHLYGMNYRNVLVVVVFSN